MPELSRRVTGPTVGRHDQRPRWPSQVLADLCLHLQAPGRQVPGAGSSPAEGPREPRRGGSGSRLFRALDRSPLRAPHGSWRCARATRGAGRATRGRGDRRLTVFPCVGASAHRDARPPTSACWPRVGAGAGTFFINPGRLPRSFPASRTARRYRAPRQGRGSTATAKREDRWGAAGRRDRPGSHQVAVPLRQAARRFSQVLHAPLTLTTAVPGGGPLGLR